MMTYEILPGEGVGPFRLGMRHAEIQALGIGTLGIFPDRLGAHVEGVGVAVHYDRPLGRCVKIEAYVGYGRGHAAQFVLIGTVVNELRKDEVLAIVERLAGAPLSGYAAPSLGLEASTWELRDDFFFSISVVPRRKE